MQKKIQKRRQLHRLEATKPHKVKGKEKMKKFKRIVAGILVLFGVIVLMFGISSIPTGDGFNIIFSFIVAAACLYGAFNLFDFQIKKKAEKKPEATYQTTPLLQPRITITREETYIPDKPEQPSGFPHKRGRYIAYHYDDVQMASRDKYADIPLEAGDKLKFVPQPDNQFDAEAVAIYKGTDKVGYMYRGWLQDMTHDFLKRGDAVAGVAVSDDFSKAVYKIAYYKRDNIE